MYAIVFIFNAALVAAFVSMTFHFWMRLPLRGEETHETRQRWLIEWAVKGIALPLLIWFIINLGPTRWLPPFLPQVDHLKNTGKPWFWPSIGMSSVAMGVVASYWAAMSLALLLEAIRRMTEDRGAFNGSVALWSLFTLPVAALVFALGGWVFAGFATAIWLAGVVHGTMPSHATTRRAPSYSQAIARIKFGKYAEAEQEVIEELERCESDFNGWMLLAELYALHFNEFEQAEQAIIGLCEQPGMTASEVSVALHRLADWHLDLRSDPEAARRCMDAISKRYAGTHLDKMAQLRKNRIPETADELAEQRRTKTYHLPALHDELEAPGEVVADNLEETRQRADFLAQKLTRDPNNAAAREDFARMLFKLDKSGPAQEQLDLLLDMEGQPANRRAEWLALKAAWLRRQNPGDPRVRELLERLVREFPETPQELAALRQIHLMDERARVAKFSTQKPKPRIVIRMDEPS